MNFWPATASGRINAINSGDGISYMSISPGSEKGDYSANGFLMYNKKKKLLASGEPIELLTGGIWSNNILQFIKFEYADGLVLLSNQYPIMAPDGLVTGLSRKNRKAAEGICKWAMQAYKTANYENNPLRILSPWTCLHSLKYNDLISMISPYVVLKENIHDKLIKLHIRTELFSDEIHTEILNNKMAYSII
jgi:hypothetical protein